MTDTFRKEYKALTDAQKMQVANIKDFAEVLLVQFNVASSLPECDKRQMALAKTNLEQSIMWAVKAIT